MNKTQKLNIILFGLNFENDEFFHLNTIITKAVQKFIIQTKRFEQAELGVPHSKSKLSWPN